MTGDQPRKGGQAEVYQGHDAQGKAVAIKVARHGEKERRGLLNEREALSAILRRQPECARWLVAILDEGELPDGRPFLVLPWFQHSLKSWLRLRPGLRQRIEALTQAATGLTLLHRSSPSLTSVVLHRDIKPDNLLVEDGLDGIRVVLADLGTVKERGLSGITSNTLVFTQEYAPIEQVLPLDRPVDPSVDVHALAVVVYEVLAGRRPQTVMSRTGLLTESARHLLALEEAGTARTEAENARHSELRRAPLSELVELDHAIALHEQDVNRLRCALAELVGETQEQAEALADALVEILVPSLRHALEADPRQRLSRPEVLLAALEAARALLPDLAAVRDVEAQGTLAPSAHGPQMLPRSPVPNRTPAAPGRWRLPATLGLALGAVLACAGLIALPASIAYLRGPEPVSGPVTVSPAVAVTPTAKTSRTATPSPQTSAPTSVQPRNDTSTSKKVTTAPDRQATPARQVDPTPAAIAEPPEDAPSPLPAPAPAEPTAPSTPPRVVISVAPSRGTSPYVWLDGELVAKAMPWRGAMEAGTREVEVRASADGPVRSFKIDVSAKDAGHWRVQIADGAGQVLQKVIDVSAEGKPNSALVQWCADDSVRFGCPTSSDP